MKLKNIMFVCHGNICRSPMAEFILKDKLEKLGVLDKFTIKSSATSNEEIYSGIGNPVYPPAREELLKHGITCNGKRAEQLKKSDYEKYDIFICMDAYNVKNAIRIFGHDNDNKIVKMLSFKNSDADVSDPWYTGNFSKTYFDIDTSCDFLVKILLSN